ncbi:MAG: hypothetical protein HWE10_02720 [Gammaproteobacteria bacterium]|nr:hypothetical protein [Gammaproteobacteria bacterium]
MNNKAILFTIFISVIVSLTSSCGFRLKGQYYLPGSLQTLYVSSERKFSPLATQVKSHLMQNRVKLVKSGASNISELKILPETFQRRSLSLFPNGQVAEYELIYVANAELRQPKKDPVTFSVELTREFQDDPNNALAKQKERELILSELRVIASERILAQLNTVQ